MGGGSFPIKKIILQIDAIFDSKMVPKRADVNVSPKNLQYDFQSQFGTFPKIHPFLKPQTSLTWVGTK